MRTILALACCGVATAWVVAPIRSRAGARAAATRVAGSAADMAILFDCDGVLADTERDGHRVSFNKAFEENSLGFEWGVDEYGRLCETGGGKERMTAYFNVHSWPAGYETPTTTELEKGLPLDEGRLALVKKLHARKTELFQELIAAGTVPLRPGVLRLVDEALAEDVPLAVCSTSNEAAVRTLVQTLMGDERYAKFEFFCGDAVARKKPAPDVYNLAAETLGLRPAECVVVEDSGIGLAAAKAAGMACLVTMATYTGGEDFARADRVVPSLGEDGADSAVGLDDVRALLEAQAATA